MTSFFTQPVIATHWHQSELEVEIKVRVSSASVHNTGVQWSGLGNRKLEHTVRNADVSSSNTYEMSLSGTDLSGEWSELNTLYLSSRTVSILLTLRTRELWLSSSCYTIATQLIC